MKRGVSNHSLVFLIILFLLLCQLFSVSVLAGFTAVVDPDDGTGTGNTNDQIGDTTDSTNNNAVDDTGLATPPADTDDDVPTTDSFSTNTPTVSSSTKPTITTNSITSSRSSTYTTKPSASNYGSQKDVTRFELYQKAIIEKSTSLLDEKSPATPSVTSSDETPSSVLTEAIISSRRRPTMSLVLYYMSLLSKQ